MPAGQIMASGARKAFFRYWLPRLLIVVEIINLAVIWAWTSDAEKGTSCSAFLGLFPGGLRKQLDVQVVFHLRSKDIYAHVKTL